METTAGGMIIPSINLQIIDLRRMPTEDVILYGVLVTLSAVIFIMEVRRYCQAPQPSDYVLTQWKAGEPACQRV